MNKGFLNALSCAKKSIYIYTNTAQKKKRRKKRYSSINTLINSRVWYQIGYFVTAEPDFKQHITGFSAKFKWLDIQSVSLNLLSLYS